LPSHSRARMEACQVAGARHPYANSPSRRQQAAQTLGMQLQFVPATNPEEITDVLSVITREQVDVLSVFPSPILFAAYRHIARISAENRLPSIYAAREGAEAGGLMSYGANLPDLARQTAAYVDKILKGAQPADLPVQQPTKFELEGFPADLNRRGFPRD
ncbi:MAG: ABC transporter substrate binding protein, partial [Xanthobacteraceae bacterium]